MLGIMGLLFGIAGVIIILSVVLPGLLTMFFGFRTWRKDKIALETTMLFLPRILFVFLLFIGFVLIASDLLPKGTKGVDPLWEPDSEYGFDVFFFLFLFGGVLMSLVVPRGNILVLRAGVDDVHTAIQRILKYRDLSYQRAWDEYTLPSVPMTIKVTDGPTSSNFVIITKTKVKFMNKLIQDDLLNYFLGTASDRSHLSWIIIGGIVTGVGAGIAVVFIII